MQSKSTRIAYLKRMLKRLEGEEARLKDLVTAGELTEEGSELGAEQLKRNRAELLSELRTLEGEIVTH
jgi:hypothetical protein